MLYYTLIFLTSILIKHAKSQRVLSMLVIHYLQTGCIERLINDAFIFYDWRELGMPRKAHETSQG